ncbi:hypothetical protein [Terrihalobacillus insolitus]|uniref:hypothetical protein n=1 Tax=Terrihalobacillus insolitus TaxID=2950438 RepID=UPI002340907A|nr:hypothetical protein [Terrihalobacillus insolitus]MDC3414934.1 hypothetical protein [Terrihalobacillus insolitus]
MPKDKVKYISTIIVGALIGLLGIIMIFSSIKFGISSAGSWLESRGGADSNYYNVVVQSYINSFLVAGGILFGFGLLIITFVLNKFIK